MTPRPSPPSSASALDLYRAIHRFAVGARGTYVGAMILLAAASGVRLLVPWLAGSAINLVQSGTGEHLTRAGLLVLGVFAAQVIAWMMHFPGRILERNTGVRVRAAMADALYARLVSLPFGWHEARHSGELQQRVQQATRALYDFTQGQFIYLQSVVNILGPLVALSFLAPSIGAAAIVAYALLGVIVVRFDLVMIRLQRAENAADRHYVAGMLDFLGNVSTVLSLRLERASRTMLGTRLQKVFVPLRRNILVNEIKWCTVELLCAAMTWTLVALYVWRAYTHANGHGALLLGSTFMVYQYAQQAAGVVTTMAVNFQNFTRYKTDFAAAAPIWSAAPRVVPTAVVRHDWDRIELRGLSFTHAGARANAVQDLAFAIARGERIALVGPSGSGKSTLLRLLAGLYEPTHGYYCVDGEALFGARSLANIATLVPQEADVFEATIRDNLALGVAHPDDVLQRAAHIAGFDAVLATLPEGLETKVSERGFNLSGGQRQRLALARGLVAAMCAPGGPSSLLLLDEPTSALDQATEADVFGRLRSELPGTAIIASVHRLAALEYFDRAVLMVDGRLVDVGTASELAARQGIALRDSGVSSVTDVRPTARAAAS